jgi:hypothetical protein
MSHGAFIELNEDLVREYYADCEYKTWHGFRFLAIDGSRIQLPDNESIRTEFGTAENKGRTVPMATISIAYDVLNHINVHSLIGRYEASERALADVHCDKIKELTPALRDVILLDRGYPSLYLMLKMAQNGINFVIRCNGDKFLSEVREFERQGKNDSIITIFLNREHGYRKQQAQMAGYSRSTFTFRVVKIVLDSGTIEYLVTSLVDRKEYSLHDVGDLYHLRWGCETNFNFQKNVFEIENLSGKSPEAVRQDYFARTLTQNLNSLIIEEAQSQIDEEYRSSENPIHINRSVAIGILKDEVIKMLCAPQNIWEIKFNILVGVVKRHTISDPEHRSFKRTFRLSSKGFLKKRKVF